MNNVNETARLLGEVQMLAFLVNEHTEYAVFTAFQGHVKEWSLRICVSKDRFNERLTSDEFYVNHNRWGDPIQKLKTMKLQLRKILRDNKISYNELNYTIREERDYSLI
ncbi:MAG: hypothetical protein ACQEXX_19775 [Bacillota bacterium]